MKFSVLILTYNEEISLPRLLDRLVAVTDDIVVLDSCSSDATQDIARKYGCRIFERPFDGERNQRAYANTLPFRYPWIYNPDADEIPDDTLIEEMRQAAQDASAISAYEVRFRNYMDGTWIKHSTDYPVWVIRFFRPERLSFERNINLRYVVNGSVGRFKGHFDHYPFAKGIAWWISKHNTYSTKEAEEAFCTLKHQNFTDALRSAFARKNSKARRLALKELSFYFPFRGFLRFMYSYFLRRGFVDGAAGLKYCMLISIYEFLISVKMKELSSNFTSKNKLH